MTKWRGFVVAAVAAVWLAVPAAVQPASADFIAEGSQFSFVGIDRYNLALNTIGFVPVAGFPIILTAEWGFRDVGRSADSLQSGPRSHSR